MKFSKASSQNTSHRNRCTLGVQESFTGFWLLLPEVRKNKQEEKYYEN
jgi:hypothetical protein